MLDRDTQRYEDDLPAPEPTSPALRPFNLRRGRVPVEASGQTTRDGDEVVRERESCALQKELQISAG